MYYCPFRHLSFFVEFWYLNLIVTRGKFPILVRMRSRTHVQNWKNANTLPISLADKEWGTYDLSYIN